MATDTVHIHKHVNLTQKLVLFQDPPEKLKGARVLSIGWGGSVHN